MAYCRTCAGVLVRRILEGRRRDVCGSCGAVHWENPIPAVGAVVVRDGRVLLCRRARPPRKSLWDLPGGIMEVGEGPEEALCREVAEETGLRLAGLRLLGIWTGRYGRRHTLNLLYEATAEGEPDARDDVAEARWFPLQELPELAWAHEAEALSGAGRA